MISPFVSKVALIPPENAWNDDNEFYERNEQNEKNECNELILWNELLEDELADPPSMNRTRETSVTNETNRLMATSVFASTIKTNSWF